MAFAKGPGLRHLTHKGAKSWKTKYLLLNPLKKWRFANGVTLKEIAEKTGKLYMHLSNIERGEFYPTKELLYEFSHIMGKDYNKLVKRWAYWYKLIKPYVLKPLCDRPYKSNAGTTSRYRPKSGWKDFL